MLAVPCQFVLQGLIERLTTKLAQIHILRLQELQQFLLVSLDPVESSLELLLILSTQLHWLALRDRAAFAILRVARLLLLVREGFARSRSSGSGLSCCGQASTWASKMASSALADQLVDRVALEHTEEAETVNASKVLDQQIELLLLDQELFVVDLFVVCAFIIFHGLVLTLFQFFEVSLLLGRCRSIGRRL